MKARNIIIKALRKVTGTEDIHLQTPEQEDHGDYATNVALQLKNLKTKKLKDQLQVTNHQSPRETAQEIVNRLKADKELTKVVDKIEVAGPGFINFFLEKEYLIDQLSVILNKKDSFGKSDLYKGQKYLIEHTSPNPNKAMHLGHLRNNVTGMAIANLWEFVEAKVVRDDVDNNRGIAIARLMWGYLKFAHKETEPFGKSQSFDQKKMINYWYDHKEEWKKPEDLNIRPDKFVDELYVKASKDFKEDKETEKQVRKIVVDWEARDEKNWELWKTVLEYSHKGQEMTLSRLGNRWDKIWHEHEHYQMGKDIVEEGLKKGIFKKGKKGAIITDLEKYDLPDTVVIKADGTALYITQDLALTKLKKETFNPDKLFWVIGPEQTLALKQLFAVSEQLGISKRENLIHISFGWMSIKGQGKMSSRLGNVVYIDDLLDKSKSIVQEIMNSGNKRLTDDETENISEQVSIGAVKYSILKVGRTTDTAFDFKESLSFEGNSGPYLQYTYARTRSVLEKARSTKSGARNKLKIQKPDIQNVSNLKNYNLDIVSYFDIRISDLNSEELSLLRTFIHFPEVISNAATNYAPNLLANYLYDLAQKYNSFYNSNKIIGSQNEDFRLSLTEATGQILKNGLTLLGIPAPHKM
jgi:arginyl-tRNA synthetase